MWSPTLSSVTLLILSVFSTALPQAPEPTPSSIPWAEKVDALRSYILSQPTSTKNAGFWNGPSYQLNFTDRDCHQIRLYNWECTYDVPYKMKGIAAWIDSQDFRSLNLTRFEDWRWYRYGYYRDPDDGWGFYDVARFSYGPCGNRGPQSACGHVFCLERNGSTFPSGPPPYHIPEGFTPYQDPSDRDRVCPWLRDDYYNQTGAA